MEIQLFDAKNIDELSWPETEAGQYAKQFLIPLVKDGTQYYIDNIDAQVSVIKVENHIFPIIAVTENYANSWVCSPYAHYISYGTQSVHRLVGNAFLASIVKSIMRVLEKISRAGHMNSVVYVNNWLFSTDLYPQGITPQHVSEIVKLLKNVYPKHAIIFRSLNQLTVPDLMNDLGKQSFQLIASRYIFVTNGKDDSIFKTRIVKSDLKLLRETSYRLVDETELTKDECNKLLDLYRLLYVEQHSHLQPQFNYKYMELLFENNLLRFKVLKDTNDQIKGVAGYYKRDHVMMCPIFGYNKDDPESNTIYRLLNIALLNEANREGLSFNQSAGASFFKSLRKAEGSHEFMAVYSKHLPIQRKIFWSTLKFFINTIGMPYMKKY